MAEPEQGNATNGSTDNGGQQPSNADLLSNAFAGANGAKPDTKPVNGDTAAGGTDTGSEVKLAPWTEQVPEDLRTASLAKFPKVGDLAKAYLDLEGKAAAGGLPGKDATPEEIAAFWEKAGKPKTHQDYSFAKEERAEEFAIAAHAANLTAAQAEAMYKSIGEIGAKGIQDIQEAQKQQIQATSDALKKEYGARYQEKIELLTRGLAAAGPNVSTLLNQAGLAGNPEIVKAFITLGQLTAESGATRGGEAGQPLKSANEGGWYDYKT